MSDPQQHDDISAALTKMVVEGGGVWQVDTFAFDADTLISLFAKALDGDMWAGTTLAGIEGIHERSTTDHPMMCFSCDTVFNKYECPAYILRMLPKCDNPTMSAIQGICFKCAERVSGRTSLSDMIETAVRQHITQNARVLHMHGSTGNA